jgi:hypothetical protein
VGPQNQLQIWVHHPPSKNGERREFDLDLTFSAFFSGMLIIVPAISSGMLIPNFF